MTFEPNRNLINFDGKNCPLQICNESIKKVYQFLISIVPEMFTNNIMFELRANRWNYSLRITGNVSQKAISCLLQNRYFYIPLIYLDITYTVKPNASASNLKNILVNKLYLCKYNIHYNPLSFRQPDDTISDEIEKYIKKIATDYENFCFIGGECVLFSKIIETNTKRTHQNVLFFTDTQSIYIDIQTNIIINLKNSKSSLIDYKTYDIAATINTFFADKRYCIILNTSKHGMGKHLSTEIAKTLSSRVAIISCNRKSLNIDLESLFAGGYSIQSQNAICTNYEVTVTVLG